RRVIYYKGDIIRQVPIYNGRETTLNIVANQDIVVMVPKSLSNNNIKQTLSFRNYYMAPIKQGDKIATLDITVKDSDYNISYDLFAEESVEKSMTFFRYLLSPYYAIKKLLGS
ncbi:MAG: hypothetical protein LBQ34_06590, partial [Alphaproteobacteria bacterium]|nr:hypothetical protein [Alphaproteobacteria bacterium]